MGVWLCPLIPTLAEFRALGSLFAVFPFAVRTSKPHPAPSFRLCHQLDGATRDGAVGPVITVAVSG